MGRLFLLVVFGLVTTYYFPDSRQMLTDAVEPIVQPVVRWATRDEMATLGRAVVEHEATTGEIPSRRSWQPWLDWRVPTDASRRDPWGTTYQLRAWADSVAIISYGPDRVRNTEDDFQVVTPRERRR